MEIECAASQEPHTSGASHMHAVAASRKECKAWDLLEVCSRGRHIACHVQIGDGRGSRHVTKMLKYAMAPTLQKLRLGPCPYFSPGFLPPQKVLDLRSKAFASIAGKPATHEEAYEYVCQVEELNSYEKFEDYVDNGRKNDPGGIRLAKLSKFLSRNAKDGRKLATFFRTAK